MNKIVLILAALTGLFLWHTFSTGFDSVQASSQRAVAAAEAQVAEISQ